MLDKSLRYYDMLMCCPAQKIAQVEEPALPQGYTVHTYQSGDIEHWASIETSVGEFDSEEAAKAYFTKTFLPYEKDLYSRCFFIADAKGNYVATATTWWNIDGEEGTAMLHWVSVRPEEQGKGLGKAVVQQALSLFKKVEPNKDVYLHTQTWSHKAVGVYLGFGFYLLKNQTIPGNKNDAEKALQTLNGHMKPELYNILAQTAR